MKSFVALLLTLAFAGNVTAQSVVQLPAPNPLKSSKMTLMQALQQRHSVREYASKAISDQTLSTLLWAACGINRPADKRITAPSAMNNQDVKVYVCRADGAYRYEPDGQLLQPITTEDLRPAIAGRQDFAKAAPVCLLLVSDQSYSDHPSIEFGALDAGYVSQNICLAATALGLATVPRASMDKDALRKALGLNDKTIILINHPVGWPQ